VVVGGGDVVVVGGRWVVVVGAEVVGGGGVDTGPRLGWPMGITGGPEGGVDGPAPGGAGGTGEAAGAPGVAVLLAPVAAANGVAKAGARRPNPEVVTLDPNASARSDEGAGDGSAAGLGSTVGAGPLAGAAVTGCGNPTTLGRVAKRGCGPTGRAPRTLPSGSFVPGEPFVAVSAEPSATRVATISPAVNPQAARKAASPAPPRPPRG
jgi:hypothetical protein